MIYPVHYTNKLHARLNISSQHLIGENIKTENIIATIQQHYDTIKENGDLVTNYYIWKFYFIRFKVVTIYKTVIFYSLLYK